MKKDLKAYVLWMSVDLLTRVKTYAASQRLSMRDVITKAILEYLNESERMTADGIAETRGGN